MVTPARALPCRPRGALVQQVRAALLALLLGAAAPALAQPAPAPGIAAQSYLLLDVASGQVIAAENADERRDPASLTKLMTAYLAFGALRDKAILPTQLVPVSAAAWRAEGSRMFIEPKKAVTVDELLRGMIVQSGNDASIALAEVVAGSEDAFAERMNREAARLGLANTRFSNATGLSHPQHYSTATDLGRLAAALIRDFPDDYKLYSLREFRYNNITQANRNRLLWIDPFVDGMKTGHTDAAGWCLIASAKRGERRLIAVVLGAASDAARAAEAQKLLNYGFQNVRPRPALCVGQAGVEPPRVEGRGQRRRGGVLGGPVRHAAEGQGGEARALDDGHGAAGRAGDEGPGRGHRQGLARGGARGGVPARGARRRRVRQRLRPRLGHHSPVVQVKPQRGAEVNSRRVQ